MVVANANDVETLDKAVLNGSLFQGYCFPSEFEGVKKDINGHYALVLPSPNKDAEEVLPVGYIQVDLLDSSAVSAILENPNLSETLKEEIAQMALNAHPCNECDTCNLVSVFSPDLLPQTSSLRTTGYTVVDGVRIKVDQIERDAHVGYESVYKGNRAETVWKSIANIGLGVGGLISKSVSVFGLGYTLLDAIESASGADNVYASSLNDVQAKIRFSGITRYTYAYVEDWRIGCVSHYAKIDELSFSYDFYENSVRKHSGEISYDLAEPLKTDSYDNHWAIARNNYQSPKVDDFITCTLGPKTFYLNID